MGVSRGVRLGVALDRLERFIGASWVAFAWGCVRSFGVRF